MSETRTSSTRESRCMSRLPRNACDSPMRLLMLGSPQAGTALPRNRLGGQIREAHEGEAEGR
jgi:hypothetical protein